MNIPTDWEDRITIEDGKITRILQAQYCTKKTKYYTYTCDVYKENEDRESWSQNLYSSIWGGVAVCFPGLPVNSNRNSWYYDTSIAEEEGWYKRGSTSHVGMTCFCTNDDIDLVCSLHPSFRYLANKFNINSKAGLLRYLQMWKKHPELELVLAAGYERVGMNGNFWRLSEKNRKELCLFMRKYGKKYANFSLKELRECVKSGKPEVYAEYIRAVPGYQRSSSYDPILFEDYLYLKKYKGEIPGNKDRTLMARKIQFFSDLSYLLNQTAHDKHDEYWRHPRDLVVTHDRLREEVEAIREAERMAQEMEALKRQAELTKKRKKEANVLNGIIRKWGKLPTEIDGYSIYVTKDINDWEIQAHELHQCIIANGYFENMCRKKYVIVFIRINGKPEATAQIMPDGSVLQFYANELDRDNCLPSPATSEAFYKWLAIAKEKGVCPYTKEEKEKMKSEVAA